MQLTWQGPDPQAKSQAAPSSHVQVPSAHEAEHVDPERQSIEHGGESQLKLQLVPPGQPQVPFEQSPSAEGWHPTSATSAANRAHRETLKTAACIIEARPGNAN